MLCGRSANKTTRDKCYGAFSGVSSRAEDTADTEIVGENSVVKEKSERRRIEKKKRKSGKEDRITKMGYRDIEKRCEGKG